MDRRLKTKEKWQKKNKKRVLIDYLIPADQFLQSKIFQMYSIQIKHYPLDKMHLIKIIKFKFNKSLKLIQIIIINHLKSKINLIKQKKKTSKN